MDSARSPTSPITSAPASKHPSLVVSLVAIALIAFAVRASTISWQGLFGDESQCVNIACAPSLEQMIIWLRDDSNTPLLYFILRLWISLFGPSDISTKLICVLISTALPTAAFAVFHKRLGLSRTWQFCLLLSLCPTLIRFGDLVRNYGLLSIVSLLGTFLLLRLIEKPSSKVRIVSYGVTLACILYTHLWGLAMVIGHILAMSLGTVIRCWNRKQFIAWLQGSFIGLIVFSPWLPILVYQIQQHENVWAFQKYSIPEMILMWPLELLCTVSTIKYELLADDPIITWVFCHAFFWTALFFPSQKEVTEKLNPLLWKLVLIGALTGGMLLVQAGYPLRPNYLIEFTPLLLLLYVFAFDNMLKPLPKMVRLILPVALWLPVWVPPLIGLPKVPEASFAFVSARVAKRIDANKDLVVVSPEEFTSQVIRYMPDNIRSTSFPDGDHLAVMKWAGIDSRIRDESLNNQVYPKMEAVLKNGGAIWFFHTSIPNKIYPQEIEERPIFGWLQIHRSREVQTWLRAHAVQVGPSEEFGGRELVARMEVYRAKAQSGTGEEPLDLKNAEKLKEAKDVKEVKEVKEVK